MVAKQVVYLDVVFLINLMMDYLLLWTAGKVGQLKTSALRLGLASLVGAGYSLLLFWPEAHFFITTGAKVGFSVVMVLVAYRWSGLRSFLTALLYFYLAAFSMGGAMLGAIYFFSSSTSTYGLLNGLLAFLGDVPYAWLLAAVAAAVLLARWGALFVRRNFLRSFFQVPVIIRFNHQDYPVQALVDTGNQLRDPLTQKPVMIAEYGVIKSVFPKPLQELLEAKNEVNYHEVVGLLAGTPLAQRLHVIPFTSIGRVKGMLLGFRPDEVIVVSGDRPVKVKDIIVGIYQQQLSPEGAYRALLHPDIFQLAI